jgi:hypothetical protein
LDERREIRPITRRSGHALGHLQLHKQDDALWGRREKEKSVQKWTRNVIWNVCNDAPAPAPWEVRRKINGERVAMHEGQLPRAQVRRKLLTKSRNQIVIKLNGNDVRATGEQSLRQESKPRTDLQDRLAFDRGTRLHDAITHIQIVEEVLAKALLGRMAINPAAA